LTAQVLRSRFEAVPNAPWKKETMSAEDKVEQNREPTLNRVEGIESFDYGAPAELFPSRMKKGRGRITYKRFDTAAEAIRFAMEEVPPPALLGVYLEVNEAQYRLPEIQYLYERAAYPLKRRVTELDAAKTCRSGLNSDAPADAPRL
jgi:hypothetical protein